MNKILTLNINFFIAVSCSFLELYFNALLMEILVIKRLKICLFARMYKHHVYKKNSLYARNKNL